MAKKIMTIGIFDENNPHPPAAREIKCEFSDEMPDEDFARVESFLFKAIDQIWAHMVGEKSLDGPPQQIEWGHPKTGERLTIEVISQEALDRSEEYHSRDEYDVNFHEGDTEYWASLTNEERSKIIDSVTVFHKGLPKKL